MNQKIAKIIKDIRISNHLTQKEFARKYHVTYQAVSKWETGKNIPDLETLQLICHDYHLNLNDLCKKKKQPKIILVIVLIIILLLGIYYLINHEETFEFKTISASCQDFNIYGSIAYNDNKTAIYISNISYHGNQDNLYKKVSCKLYEIDNETKTLISEYDKDSIEPLTLDDYLQDVSFKIDHYANNCKMYLENALKVEIEATTIDDITIYYEIPLTLEDNC